MNLTQKTNTLDDDNMTEDILNILEWWEEKEKQMRSTFHTDWTHFLVHYNKLP